MNLTAAEAASLLHQQRAKCPGRPVASVVQAPEAAASPITPRARGRQRTPGQMNRLETRYAAHLEQLSRSGEVAWYAYEAVKLRLAPKTFFTPDFFVMLTDGTLEVHETKGFWEEDARVKIKVAAEKFPFRFVGIKKSKAGWEVEEF